MSKIKDFFYNLKKRINLQFIKQSWLDMKRDKAKTIFGILGITTSLFLLTAIGMLNDTMGYNYIKLITNTTGEADILITRTLQADLTFDPFFPEDIIKEDLQNIEGVDEWFPRIMMLVKTSSDNTNATGSLQLYGIDFMKEYKNGNIGDLLIVDEKGEETGEIYDDEPAWGECVILWNVAEILNVSINDEIHMEYQQYERTVTVSAICVHDLKFMQFESALIIVSLEYAQDFLKRPGKLNMLYGTIEDRRHIYDASDLDETTRKLREIGTRIQERLDINEYSVTLPKLEELEGGEFMLMGTTMIFWFITILSMLITGILINSILSTSAEERVREFGISRVVGGKKTYPLKIVLFEGFLLGFIGSILGIILGITVTKPFAETLLVSMFDFMEPGDIEFIIKPSTILLAFSIGTLVSLVVALLPAIRTARINLIKAITPFQTKEEGWEIKKEGSMNMRSFLIGISIATVGMIIFILFPRIMVTGDMMLIVTIFIGLLAAILIGLVFASVGIIPLIQKLFLGAISPAIKKYSHIINISLKRYRRRNTSTVVMFAISFSFIFFITSMSKMDSENMELNLRFQYGADLVVSNQGLSEDDAVTLNMVDELRTFEGVDELTYVLHNSFDITAILSLFFDASEGGMGFDDEGSEEQIMNIFSFYQQQWSQKYITRMGDVANHDNLDIGFIGVTEKFPDFVDRDLCMWKSPQSGFDKSFSALFESNNTCIIAKAIASVIGIQEIGEIVRITFYNPQIPDDPGNITLFEVVGISGGIPGFWNFRSSEWSAYGGGVMVSMENYMRLMDTKDAGEGNMVVDKIMINLADKSEENIEETKDDINSIYKDVNFIVDDAISKIKYIEEMNQRQSLIMEIILMFTVMICIFGLISSMYAVMLERKFEIGILRSMGMKSRNVRNMFLIESIVIMLSAGIMGTLIGSYCAYLMETNLGLLTEMPVIFAIPMDTLIRVFVISVGIGVIGMYLVLMKLSRQSIMDIFRQTF